MNFTGDLHGVIRKESKIKKTVFYTLAVMDNTLNKVVYIDSFNDKLQTLADECKEIRENVGEGDAQVKRPFVKVIASKFDIWKGKNGSAGYQIRARSIHIKNGEEMVELV